MVAVQEGSLSSAVALGDSGAVRRPPVEQLAALATDGIERALKRASISPMCWGWRDQEMRHTIVLAQFHLAGRPILLLSRAHCHSSSDDCDGSNRAKKPSS